METTTTSSHYRPLRTPPSTPPRLADPDFNEATRSHGAAVSDPAMDITNDDRGMLDNLIGSSQSADPDCDEADIEERFNDNSYHEADVDNRNKFDGSIGDDEASCLDLQNERLRSRGIVALSLLPFLLCILLGSRNARNSTSAGSVSPLRSSSSSGTNLDGSSRSRHPYFTTVESWNPDQVAQYEYKNTPQSDPRVEYYPRIRDQNVAEIANTEEEVKFITNSADIAEVGQPYTLLIRVLSAINDGARLQETKDRWDAALEQFAIPEFVRTEVEFVSPPSRKGKVPMKTLFALPSDDRNGLAADWIFVVQDSTYVNLARLVRRLIADVDPTRSARMGLLVPHKISISDSKDVVASVPLLEAGILLTHQGLAEIWDSPDAKSCWDKDSLLDWTACNQAVDTTLTWSSMAGLNPMNVRDMMRQSLEGPLFNDTAISHLYDSVGGPLRGTARLPITYANMTLELFNDQLAVDTNQGKVPKILHHIWSGPLENMAKETREGAEQCRKMHEDQGWEYMLWTDETLKALPGLPSVPYMEGNLKFVRHYVDTIRYYLLHQFGGIYIDMDAFCMRPFDPLLTYSEAKGTDLLMNYESQRHRGRQIANGILVAAPASPVLSAFILHLGYRLKKHHAAFIKDSSYRYVLCRSEKELRHRGYFSSNAWIQHFLTSPFASSVSITKIFRRAGRITGPWMVTEVREQWESWVKDHLYVLSSSAFIPMYREGDEANLEGSADVFSLAKSQGSYTVQIYHSGALKNLLHGASTPSSSPKIVKVNDHSDDSSAIISTASKEDVVENEVPAINNEKQSVLMVVAHPDDEVLVSTHEFDFVYVGCPQLLVNS